jgi:ferric iron reductase protein FhuF
LAAALSHMQRVDPEAYADIGTVEAGWLTVAAFCDPQTTLLEAALARQAQDYPHMEDRTRGAYLIGEYSWYVPLVAITAYLAQQRVPDFSRENVAVRFRTYTWHEGAASGEAQRLDVRFLSGRFACLPDDVAADHPDAQVLPDGDALREHLRTTLEGHLTPIIERVYAETKLSHHAQWMLVADSCAALFLHSGQALGAEAYAKAEGMVFVKAPSSPMNNAKTTYISLQYRDHCDTFRARGGCCRYYTVSESGADYCTTCVLRPPEDRDQRLLAYMAKKYAQEATS